MAQQYDFISSDTHLEVLPERWAGRVPTQYRDKMPRTVTHPDGGDAIQIEGAPLFQVDDRPYRASLAAAKASVASLVTCFCADPSAFINQICEPPERSETKARRLESGDQRGRSLAPSVVNARGEPPSRGTV